MSHTTIKNSVDTSRHLTVGKQISVAVLQDVEQAILAIGKAVRDMLDGFTKALRRMFAILARRQTASTPCSAAMVRRLIVLLRASQGTVFTPGTGNILACFKRVTLRDLDMDSRGTHMFNPNQHITISLMQDAIGHPGRVSHDEYYQCITM